MYMFFDDVSLILNETSVQKVNAKVGPMVPGSSIDCCLLEQYNKQVGGFEMELLDISHSIATMEDTKELPDEKSWTPTLSLA